MRFGLARYSWILSLAAAWGLTCCLEANDGLLPRLPASATKKETARPATDPAYRNVEIQVELALLSDPATFPYYLEAKASSTRVEIHGYVPNRAVREEALKLARLHSPLPVVDAMREHASLTVHTAKLAPQQLKGSVQTALSQALPAAHQGLHVDCGADGKVSVAGTLRSHEDKLAVSQALRRLHGCSCVHNSILVQPTALAEGPPALPGAVSAPPALPTAAAPTLPPPTPEIQPVELTDAPRPQSLPPVSPPPAKEEKVGFFGRLFGRNKKTQEAPPQPTLSNANKAPQQKRVLGQGKREAGKPATADQGGIPSPLPAGLPLPVGPQSTAVTESPGVILLPGPDAGKKTKALTPAQLKTRLEQAYPNARPINITVQGQGKLHVELRARNDAESGELAGQVLSLPELAPYEVDLHVRVDPPK